MIKPFEKPIYVTRPALPPLEEFHKGLAEIWDRAWFTHTGPLVEKFQSELAIHAQT